MIKKLSRFIICNKCGRKYSYSREANKRAGHTTIYCNSCVTLIRHKKLKEKFVKQKGGKCIKCGYKKCLDALMFHHRDSKQKAFNLGNNFNRGIKILQKEIDKCDLLCLNCHMEEHAEKRKKKLE